MGQAPGCLGPLTPCPLPPIVPTAVAFLKEVESPYDVHDCIRSYLGDTLEAKEFAKQFLERRAKQKASAQRQLHQVPGGGAGGGGCWAAGGSTGDAEL